MDKEKHVDESWKEQASQEKETLADSTIQQSGEEQNIINDTPRKPTEQPKAQSQTSEQKVDQDQDIEVDFLNYITSLGFQAMIFMGEVPNPVTKAVEKNLKQAKFLIDTLSMLKDKTAGNLDDQENQLLENSIYELQMRFVQVAEQGESSQEGNVK